MNPSLVLPCLNAGVSPPGLLSRIQNSYKRSEYTYEEVLYDNGFTGKSNKISQSNGIVVDVTDEKGYGLAFQEVLMLQGVSILSREM
jgi:hypothetical protein